MSTLGIQPQEQSSINNGKGCNATTSMINQSNNSIPQSTTSSNELDWLESAISRFIGGICGVHPTSTNDELPSTQGHQLASPLILTSFVPISIPNEIAPIPQKWQTDQIIKDVVDDFDNDYLNQDFPQPSHRSNDNDTTSSIADTSPSTSRIHTTSPLKENDINVLDTTNPQSMVSEASSITIAQRSEHRSLAGNDKHDFDQRNKSKVPSSQPGTLSHPTTKPINSSSSITSIAKPANQSNASRSSLEIKTRSNAPSSIDNLSVAASSVTSPSATQRSTLNHQHFASTLDPDRRREHEEFGNMFHNTAIERLQLPKGLALQMQRIQELAKGSGNVQRLEKEKGRVKNELKEYDSQFATKFGTLPGREEKEPLRPLYMYYRRLKITIQRGSKKQQDGVSEGLSGTTIEMTPTSRNNQEEENKNAMSSSNKADEELAADEKKLLKLQQDKIQLRNKLQKFQEDFVRTEGRPIKFHRDIVSIENEYKQYKQIKEVIRKLQETIQRKRTFKQFSRERPSVPT